MVKISNARIDMEGARVDQPVFKDHGEKLGGGTGLPASTGSAYTVDLSAGNVFNLKLTAATVTFTFSNPTAPTLTAAIATDKTWTSVAAGSTHTAAISKVVK